MKSVSEENVFGAVIFWSYIVAALGLTALIGNDLLRLYNSIPTVKDNNTRSRKQRENVYTFFGLAVLSFAVLSYHMLSFLLQSFSEWSDASQQNLPRFLDNVGSGSHSIKMWVDKIWLWSKSSTLFQDFATDLASSPQRFWWTNQALLFSFGWNLMMAIEGVRYQIPNLWAYFVLGQILPSSFVQNLFLTAMFLTSTLLQDELFAPSSRVCQWSVLVAFLASLSSAPLTTNTPWYLVSLMFTRLMLFAPFILVKPSRLKEGQFRNRRVPGPFFDFKILGILLGLMLQVMQTWKAGSLLKAVSAIHENHAVAALGYDYLIGICSAFIYMMTKR